MLNALLKRIFAPTQKRSLDAAGGGRRWQNAPTIGNLNADLQALGTIRNRAAYQFRNNAWASRAADVLVSNLVGSGIRPQSQHPDQARRRQIEALLSSWEPDADTTGGGFYALQSLAVRSMIEAGEALIRIRSRRPEDGLAVPMQLQVLDPSQLDANYHRDLGNGRRIVSGVEFDPLDRPVAYHIRRTAPGAPFVVGTDFEPVRVDAREIIHMFLRLTPGQVRGLSWLSPAMLRLHELDQTEDAQGVRQKIGALLTGFITDMGDGTGGFDGVQSGADLDVSMEPGALRVLAPGQDIRFSEPPETGQYLDFVRQQLRAIGAALGITYEQLSGDMSGVNYSSARVSLAEVRRRFRQIQQTVIIPQLLRPVWRTFIDSAVLSGALRVDPLEAYPCKWQAEAWEHVDPEKSVKADVLAVQAGFKSRSQVVAEHGLDAEDLDDERAEDARREEALGIAPAEPMTMENTPDANNA